METITLIFITTNLITLNTLLVLFTKNYWDKLKQEEKEAQQFAITSPEEIISYFEEQL